MSLLPFLAGVTARYPDLPVLAAGGIGDGRTLAASAGFVSAIKPASEFVRSLSEEPELILRSPTVASRLTIKGWNRVRATG